jgi:hypothetical protein
MATSKQPSNSELLVDRSASAISLQQQKSTDNLEDRNPASLLQVKKSNNALAAASAEDIDVATWKPIPDPHSAPIRSWQTQAPAPATTFYNLELHSKPQQLIILREWPRRRFSQRYSHSIDPITLSTGWQQFIKYGELEDKIENVFGGSVVEDLKRLIQANSNRK